MNQRDQNQTRRGGHRQDLSSSGRQSGQAEGGRHGRGMDEDRDWQSQRQGSNRMAGGGSAGQRFGETYNPEPQWLREDRGYGGAYGRGEEDFEGSSESSGRGSYAGSGRPWGEPQGGYETSGEFGGRPAGYEQSGYERASQSGRLHGPQYGSRYASQHASRPYGSSQGAPFGESQGRFGRQEYASQDFARNLGGRGTQSGYGASRGGGGLHEYGTPGYETAGYDSDLGYTGQSMEGRGAGSQYRAGSSAGYGSGSGYQFGTYQGDTGYQRSYRGMGPQNYKRPDERIRDDIYERLTDSHEIDARQISVDVSQGNVTLTGTVPERQMRYAAEDLVEGCMGVTNINNQLTVQEASSGAGQSASTGAGAATTSTESKRH